MASSAPAASAPAAKKARQDKPFKITDFPTIDMELEERSVDFFDNIDAHPSPQELGAPPHPAEIVDSAVYEKSLRSCCHRKR